MIKLIFGAVIKAVLKIELFMTCLWHVHDMLMTCLWHAYDMFMTCLWHVYDRKNHVMTENIWLWQKIQRYDRQTKLWQTKQVMTDKLLFVNPINPKYEAFL